MKTATAVFVRKPVGPRTAICEKGRLKMKSFVENFITQAHGHHTQVEIARFFRACYMWKFHKDISYGPLIEDVTDYTGVLGVVPKYVIDYMLDYYAKKNTRAAA